MQPKRASAAAPSANGTSASDRCCSKSSASRNHGQCSRSSTCRSQPEGEQIKPYSQHLTLSLCARDSDGEMLSRHIARNLDCPKSLGFPRVFLEFKIHSSEVPQGLP